MHASRSSLWKCGIIGSVVLSGIALISASGRATTDSIPAPRTFSKQFDAPEPVRKIIQRACIDCHSEETVWPWYSNIPPISAQIHADVNNACEFMNFSRWSEYTAEEQRSFASQIAHAASTGIMPPARYLWIHRNARLSAADVETLKEWARSRPGNAVFQR